VTITFADGSKATLSANSSFHISTINGKTAVVLTSGTMQIQTAAGSALQVYSQNTLVPTHPGTYNTIVVGAPVSVVGTPTSPGSRGPAPPPGTPLPTSLL
jgi:ferric-dicitrate binding protein FerR (iron transport regulator)